VTQAVAAARHPVVTSDPGDIRAADPSLTLLSPA
jgi:hypothetical protein